MDRSSEMQRRLLMLLDKWIGMTDEEIVKDCRFLVKSDLDPREEEPLSHRKIDRKSVKKLATRLADRFSLDHDLTVCGNLYLEKISSYLSYCALELQSQVSFHEVTFEGSV